MVKIFYLCINLGCISPIATTEMEQSMGFWTAYLLCLGVFIVAITILIAGKNYYVVHPPKGSAIINAFRAMWIGLRNGASMGKSIAAIWSVSSILIFLLLIALQILQNLHTKMSVHASTKYHGMMTT